MPRPKRDDVLDLAARCRKIGALRKLGGHTLRGRHIAQIADETGVRLTATSRAVAALFRNCYRHHEDAPGIHVRVADLADETGRSRASIFRALRQLECAGVIRKRVRVFEFGRFTLRDGRTSDVRQLPNIYMLGDRAFARTLTRTMRGLLRRELARADRSRRKADARVAARSRAATKGSQIDPPSPHLRGCSASSGNRTSPLNSPPSDGPVDLGTLCPALMASFEGVAIATDYPPGGPPGSMEPRTDGVAP